MSNEVNKAIVRRIWEEVFNRRNLALADELVAPDSINHEAPPGIAPEGPESLKQIVTMLNSAFPDFRMTVEDMIAEGDQVVSRTLLSGTHQGAFMGMPPTGKRFKQQQIHVVRVVNGKAAEHWAVRDDVGMMQQLGVMPTQGH